MQSFFGGWRWTLGRLVLLIACVFMAAWVRSFYFTDMVLFPTNRAMNRWISDKHGLVWTRHSQTDEEVQEQDWDCVAGIPIPVVCPAFPQALDLRPTHYLNGNDWKQKSTCLGFTRLEGQLRGLNSTVTVRIIPHWFITAPLTLLAAYLMISGSRKSRSRNDLKASESTSSES